MKITKKEFEAEKKEILEYFSPLKMEVKNSYIYQLETIYGLYTFRFSDNDTIFGRFEDIQKYDNVLKKENNFNININIYSGKMNFHFSAVYDFINVLDRLVI